MKTYVIVYFGTLIFAMVLVPIISRLAKWYRLLDIPDPRKVHEVPVPRIGGIAFVISTFTLVLAVFFFFNDIGQSFRQSNVQFIALLTGAAFMFAVGLYDDLRPLRGYIKLLCIVLASLVICASGATISSISLGTSVTLDTGWVAWPLTIFWITMITVCMGFIDGLDGLAAGVAIIVCGTMVLIALWSGQAAMAVLMLALLGSVTGFLIFNFHPAKIFMGDCGSMFLGFMIAGGSLVCQMKTSTLVGLAIPFLVLCMPILDTSFVVICRRILDRRSIFSPDRSHLHHRLLDLGLRQVTVVVIIYSVTIISASIGIFMLTTKGGLAFVLLACGLLLLLTLFACLQYGRIRKILKAVKRNWHMACRVKVKRQIFETAQVKMRQSGSFDEWWNTLCEMGEKMRFHSINLYYYQNGRYVSNYEWNSPNQKSTGVRIVNLNLPLEANGSTRYELKVSVLVDGHLELGCSRIMFLGRLMDEFPPPQQTLQAETDDKPVVENLLSKAMEKEAENKKLKFINILAIFLKKKGSKSKI